MPYFFNSKLCSYILYLYNFNRHIFKKVSRFSKKMSHETSHFLASVEFFFLFYYGDFQLVKLRLSPVNNTSPMNLFKNTTVMFLFLGLRVKSRGPSLHRTGRESDASTRRTVHGRQSVFSF